MTFIKVDIRHQMTSLLLLHLVTDICVKYQDQTFEALLS